MLPKANDLSVTSNVEMRPDVGIGNMTRKSLYRFECYEPLPVHIVKAVLGQEMFDKFYHVLKGIAVVRDGDVRIPIGALVDELKITSKDLLAKLFSSPVWEMESPNLVVMAGLTDSLDKHFKGSAYTAAWYVGLTSGSPTFAEGNTMATHAGWVEVLPYSDGTRPALTLGTVVSGSVDNSASKAVFNINATMVVGGGFVTTTSTKGMTSGTLYGGAAFSGGNRSVASGDTLNVTVTLSATAS